MTGTSISTEQLENPIRLSFPVINVSTFELSRAEYVYSEVTFKVQKGFRVMQFKQLPDPNYIKSLVTEAEKNSQKGLVVFDPHFFVRIKANIGTEPTLKTSLRDTEQIGVNYLIAREEQINERVRLLFRFIADGRK